MQTHALVAIVTLLSLITYLWIGLRVAGGRAKHQVSAPATTGHPDFERLFRAQQNTLEWLPLYLPSLWLFALYWNDTIAAALGLVWIVGRVLYALGYAREASARSAGFVIQAAATAVLLFGALGRVIWVYLQIG